MKKLAVTAIILSAIGFSSFSSAEKNTLSLGYAQSKVQDFKDIKGVNLKYRYEWDSPVSIIGSFTWMSGKENFVETYYSDRYDENTKVKYYSLSAGPAWRINQYASLYGLLGVNYNKIDYNEKLTGSLSGSSYYDESQNKASLMYGVGLQINPVEYLAIDIGYEGSRVEAGNKNHAINGFNIGLGYSF